MNYGPLEFAAYLSRTAPGTESAAVRAARAAAPGLAQLTRFTIIPRHRVAAGLEPAMVFEAVALTTHRPRQTVRVSLKPAVRPTVLVLSSHAPVRWRLCSAEGSGLEAVLLSGYGDSSVEGAGTAAVARIGGYYAFRRGSAEFRHLESEVLRCTGRAIATFTSQYAGQDFSFG
jgi:hypothetical protein